MLEESDKGPHLVSPASIIFGARISAMRGFAAFFIAAFFIAAFFIAGLAVASAFFYQETGSPRHFIAGEDAGYLEPSSCASCHRRIYEGYRRTAMGRSFYRPAPGNTVEDYPATTPTIMRRRASITP